MHYKTAIRETFQVYERTYVIKAEPFIFNDFYFMFKFFNGKACPLAAPHALLLNIAIYSHKSIFI